MRLRRPDMDPRLAKAVVLVSSLVMVLIRAPHGQRIRGIKVAKNRRRPLETDLLTLELREQHRLITQGIYRRVRHPRYLGLLKTTSCT